MKYYIWALPIIVAIILFMWIKQQQRITAAQHILKSKRKGGNNTIMKELAKQFIGKECIIYTITSNDGNVHGVIKEVGDGGMIIERKIGESEIINLDFVTRIREYPKNKNGKKKSVILD